MLHMPKQHGDGLSLCTERDHKSSTVEMILYRGRPCRTMHSKAIRRGCVQPATTALRRAQLNRTL
eukprot:6466505-Amphidinium_carterae.1